MQRMVKRCIGIDIGSSYLCAVQIARTAGEFHIEKTFCVQIRRSTDSPTDLLRQLYSRYGFDKRASAAVSMPHEAVFFRNLEIDSAGLEKIRARDWSALEHNFPIEPDKIVAQVYSYNPLPDGKHSVLIAAADRMLLRERLNLFLEAKLHLGLIEAPIFAVNSAVEINHPESVKDQAIIAYIDEHYLTLAVVKDGDILLIRSIPIVAGSDGDSGSVQELVAELLSRETQITWRKVFGTDVEQDTKVYLATTNNISGYLAALIEENLRCQAVIIDYCSKVKSSLEHQEDLPMCVAEGLALRVLAPEQTKGINFLDEGKEDKKNTIDLKKELGVCGLLVCAIVVFSIVGLFVRLSRLEADYSRIKNKTTEIFAATVPDEKIVNPLVQLEQKLNSFQRDSQLFASLSPTSLAPLDVLQRISKNIPSKANVEVDDILIAADIVRINGTSDSFKSVYQWQQILEKVPGFTFVDVENEQKQSESGIVQFTMLLSSSMQELK